MKKTFLLAMTGAMTLSINAGDLESPVAGGKAPLEECHDVGGEISAGYLTDFIFQGSRLGRDSTWFEANYTIPGILPLTVGAWYLNGINPIGRDFDELDVYARAALGSFGGFDVELGYIQHVFPDGEEDTQGEFGLDLRRSLGFVDLELETNYNYTLNAWYHQGGIEKSFGLTDSVSLVLGAGVSWNDGYIQESVSNWNHYYATASLPIKLNCRATFTPYVGYNGDPSGWAALDFVDGQNLRADVLHAGASLTVSF